jgi:hypothetical protein
MRFFHGVCVAHGVFADLRRNLIQLPGVVQRKGSGMAKLVFEMNQSLDGYIDHMAFAPSPTLFRHFIEEAQGQALLSRVIQCSS